MGFPIDRISYRALDPSYEGSVVVADIDRTYLATEFQSLFGMLRIPFEGPADKRDIDGMAQLLRELRHGPNDQSRDTPLYFVSASPRQLRPVIERKMALDGILFDGTTFKDWGRVIRRGRLRRLKEQLGFKLTALFAGRIELPVGASEILIGDDLETDPLAYALYADALAGRITPEILAKVLRKHRVYEDDIVDITQLLALVKPGRGVAGALIRLERHLHTDDFLPYAPGVLGCSGAFQMAAYMWLNDALALPGVLRVAQALEDRGISPSTLAARLRDLVRRAVLPEAQADALWKAMEEFSLVEGSPDWGDVDARWAWLRAEIDVRPWTPAAYLED